MQHQRSPDAVSVCFRHLLVRMSFNVKTYFYVLYVQCSF